MFLRKLSVIDTWNKFSELPSFWYVGTSRVTKNLLECLKGLERCSKFLSTFIDYPDVVFVLDDSKGIDFLVIHERMIFRDGCFKVEILIGMGRGTREIICSALEELGNSRPVQSDEIPAEFINFNDSLPCVHASSHEFQLRQLVDDESYLAISKKIGNEAFGERYYVWKSPEKFVYDEVTSLDDFDGIL